MKEYEKKVQRAQEILNELSKNDLPLDKALKLYKEGMRLLKEVQEMLEKAKLEVKKIQKESL